MLGSINSSYTRQTNNTKENQSIPHSITPESKRTITQSVNQQIHPSIHQSVKANHYLLNNQPSHQSIDQPTTINQPVNQPTHTTNQPVNQHTTNHNQPTINQPINQSINQPTNQSINQQPNRSSLDRRVDYWRANQSINIPLLPPSIKCVICAWVRVCAREDSEDERA